MACNRVLTLRPHQNPPPPQKKKNKKTTECRPKPDIFYHPLLFPILNFLYSLHQSKMFKPILSREEKQNMTLMHNRASPLPPPLLKKKIFQPPPNFSNSSDLRLLSIYMSLPRFLQILERA